MRDSSTSFLRLAALATTAALVLAACSDDEGGGGGGGGAAGVGGGPSGTGGAPVQSSFPDAQAYVNAHNAVRASVVEPPGYPGTWVPIPPVTWSDEIAQSAQEWANHLRDSLSCGLEHAQGSGYGENLAMGTNLDAQGAVDMWTDEANSYVFDPVYSFESDTGHYTQIVWRDTTEIGCASASCNRATVVVCRYSPPGNFTGRQIY